MNCFPLLFVFVCAFCLPVRAQGDSWWMGVPFASGNEVPSWFEQYEEHESPEFSYIRCWIEPSNRTGEDLSLTVYMTEQDGGFLRVLWVGQSVETLLSANLYEGTGTWNRRTILIPHHLLDGPGAVVFQCGGDQVPVIGLLWQWLKPRLVLSTPDAPLPAILDGQGWQQSWEEVSGEPPPAPADTFRGRVVHAALVEKLERASPVTTFVFTMAEMPEIARLELEICGAPLESRAEVLLNGAEMGQLALDTPPLTDASYMEWEGAIEYIGWRRATLYIPAKELSLGENRLTLSWIKGQADCAYKNVYLQLKYSDPSTSTPEPHQNEE